MGLLDAFRKKSEPALDLPPRPEDTMPAQDPFSQPLDSGVQEAMADAIPVDAPPAVEEPVVDAPPAVEQPEVDAVVDAEPVDAPPAIEEPQEPIEAPLPMEEPKERVEKKLEPTLTPLEPLEETKDVPLEVEMPEEIKPKGKNVADKDFAQRIAKVKSKVASKEANAKIAGEMDQLRTENEYLRARIEKLTSLMESLPISEMGTRIEKVHSEHREQRGKISDMLDKLSVHSNLINETISVREDFEKLKGSNKETKKQVDLLSDSLDSYKNTLYMMNKKVELVDHSKRIDQIEGKIKEIIVYLNKITRIITKD